MRRRLVGRAARSHPRPPPAPPRGSSASAPAPSAARSPRPGARPRRTNPPPCAPDAPAFPPTARSRHRLLAHDAPPRIDGPRIETQGIRPGHGQAKETAAPQGGDAERLPRLLRRRGDRAQPMLAQIAEVYDRYGFDPLETSRWKPSRRWASSCPMWTAPMTGSSPSGGRRRHVAGAALRHDRAARPRRGAVPQRPALALSPLHDGPRLAQREAGAGAVPAVLSMRCRYGGVGVGRGGCRDLRDAGRHAGGRGHPARGLHRAGEQPEGAERRAGGRGPVGRRQGARAGDRAARHRQARQARAGGRAALLGKGRLDESGDFTAARAGDAIMA
jgi:hypothetical protein